MVEWPSSGSERTFDQSAANGRKELFLPNAAPGSKGIYVRYAHVCFFSCSALRTYNSQRPTKLNRWTRYRSSF